jgi:hypothetical protein
MIQEESNLLLFISLLNYKIMFRLIKIEENYLLTDGVRTKVDEDEEKVSYMMGLLGATMKIPGAEKLLLIDFDKIDDFILSDEEETEWDVEVDDDYNIYLKTQVI